MTRLIGAAALAEIATDPDTGIIDIRPMAAYNGWRLGGESTGGHIPGAVAFPASWSEVMSDVALVDSLADKGLDRDRDIVVYSYDDEEAASFANRLGNLGFDGVAVLEGGFEAWASQPGLEISRLARYRQLVHAHWLRRLVAGEDVDEPPDGPALLFHATSGWSQEYEGGHIPGAVHLDTGLLESSTDWNRRSAPELQSAFASLGITPKTTAILYGRDTTSASGKSRAGRLAATRAAGILLYAGVADVRVLDGGMEVWTAAGLPLETKASHAPPGSAFGPLPQHAGYFIDYEEAEQLLADSAGALVSIRSRQEHFGTTSGYDYIEGTGDIPGAIWGDSGSDAQHMEKYRNVDGTMRPFDEIAGGWAEKGITPDKHVAFYCGTGWRASEAFFDAYVMGWPNISVYDGGWFEWSRRAGGD